MKVFAEPKGVRAAFTDTLKDVETILTKTAADTTKGVKDDWRAAVQASGLGRRLANTVRGATYPGAGRTSLDPSSFVWTKAPKLMDAFDRGPIIVATSGRRFLAIPTPDAPRKRQGQPMTPAEVEQHFGRRLVFVNPSDKNFWTPSTRRPGVAYLVIPDLVVRKRSGRWRNATKNELPGGKRRFQKSISKVVMFILVPQVKVPKKLDIQAIADRQAALFDVRLAANWR